MSSTVSASPPSPAGGPLQKAPGVSPGSRKMIWLAVAILCMLVIFFSSPFAGLSVAGQRVLGVLAFALIVWVSEAISYPLSAVAIFSFLDRRTWLRAGGRGRTPASAPAGLCPLL